MAVPNLGKYKSPNKTIEIEINSANPSNGTIQAEYENEFTPVGVLSVKGQLGEYRWVDNPGGGSGTAPFTINFTASSRPAGRPYSITEIWNGYYTKKNTLLLTGTRGYVNKNGDVVSVGLGTVEFSQ
ncbi:hypothetical protein [uncultured Kordia sp.]|uniref:hypothetical protein n=1 Tax=uncultured Kordia sp. TaxID=507699 RepID=UPI002602DFB9|nr:hypothetical protein [uncultured Kordia sp.]